MDVVENRRNGGSYRDQLVASQKQAAAVISSKLGVEINVTHNYAFQFNGFAFEGEYRLVEQIEALEGMHAFVSQEWESPTLYSSTGMFGAIDAWELGYSGKGYTVAILDTGCRIDHPAFSTMPDQETVQFGDEDIEALIAEGNLHGASSEGGMDLGEVYVSTKIPFQWNYYYNHADASHPGTSDHGTHVAGTAGGNNDEIRGVAPDAQLAIMQVFSPSGSASWANIIPALEDCAVLGVASANMSFGSACGREMGDGTIYGLGINPYVATDDLSYYLEDRNAISPNDDRFLDTLNVVYAGLLRNSAVRYVVCDTEGNELHEIYEYDICPKGYRTMLSGRSQLGLTYMNFPGNFDFTQFEVEDVVVRIIADLDNDGHYTTNAFTPEVNENPSWDIPIHVDPQAPTISNVYVSGAGVTFDATDDHYVAVIIVMNEYGEVISTQGVFETERGAATNVTVQLEVGQYVVVADYAGNEQWFEFVGAHLIPIDPPELEPQLIYSQGFNPTDNLAG